jgi:hypothetical protein
MAEVRRQRDKIHSTICEHCIPERGAPGEIWIAKDTGSFWYVTVDGITVCLTDVLNNRCAHTPPRAGRDGVDGISVKGESGPCGNGRDGKDGRDGRNGADSVVPGPAGRVGKDGTDGKDSPQREEFTAFLNEVRKLTKELRQRSSEQDEQIRLLREYCVGVTEKSQSYLEFLRQRVQERQRIKTQ